VQVDPHVHVSYKKAIHPLYQGQKEKILWAKSSYALVPCWGTLNFLGSRRGCQI